MAVDDRGIRIASMVKRRDLFDPLTRIAVVEPPSNAALKTPEIKKFGSLNFQPL